MDPRWWFIVAMALACSSCCAMRSDLAVLDLMDSAREVLADDQSTTGKSSCAKLVPLAKKRSGLFHFTATCKCKAENSVLSAGCGSQAGERKFDVTRVGKEVGVELPAPDKCTCVDKSTLESHEPSKQAELPENSEESVKTTEKPTVTCADKVPDSMEREGWFQDANQCKCIADDSVLTGVCGSQLGDRKFDMTGLPETGCYCAKTTPGPTTTKTTTTTTTTITTTTTTLGCGDVVPNAMPREGWHPFGSADCKCDEDWYLSKECGALARTRKFDRSSQEVTQAGCRCETELQQMSDPDAYGDVQLDVIVDNSMGENTDNDASDFATEKDSREDELGKTEDEHHALDTGIEDQDKGKVTSDKEHVIDKVDGGDEDLKDKGKVTSDEEHVVDKVDAGDKDLKTQKPPDNAKLVSEPKCKHEQPEGFKFGDIVRIQKQVQDGYYIPYLWAAYKDAGVHGWIAQVVCPQGTTGTKGRVCLRHGGDGPGSMGCWLPANLVKLDSEGDEDSD